MALYKTTFASCFENLRHADHRALTVLFSLLGYLAFLTLGRHRSQAGWRAQF